MAPNNFLQLYFGILSSPAYGKTIEYYSPSSMFFEFNGLLLIQGRQHQLGHAHTDL